MKKLILCDQAPEDTSGALSFTVTIFNVEDVISQFKDMAVSLVLYITRNVEVASLLKLVEDYRGDLLVYFAGVPNLMFLSRFEVVEKWTKLVRAEFPKLSKAEKSLRETKELVC
jgi:hypothetical protein